MQPILWERKKKSQTVPDQSMSIGEIVKRFVRGIPVDVIKREPVYIDQGEYDLEKMSRMDFGERAEMAQQLRQENEEFEETLKANERAKRARAAQAATQKTDVEPKAEPKA